MPTAIQPLSAIDVIAAFKCPQCNTRFEVFDGQTWTFDVHGYLEIDCKCGSIIRASIVFAEDGKHPSCATCISDGFKRGYEAAVREFGQPLVACGERFMKLDVTFTCKLAKGHMGKHAPIHAPAIDVETDFFRSLEVACDICDQPIYKVALVRNSPDFSDSTTDVWVHQKDGKIPCYELAHPLFDPLCMARPRTKSDQRRCANCRRMLHRIGEERERRWFHVEGGDDHCPLQSVRMMAVPRREEYV